MAQSFKDLTVWQRSIEMSVAIYDLTREFPREEIYGLTSQLRRAAVSVSSNIAEGRGRLTQGEFRQFLGLAQGSNCEMKIGNFEKLNKAEALSVEVGKMLSALIANVSAKS